MQTRRAKAAAAIQHAAASSTKTPSPSPTPTIPGAPKKRKRVVVDTPSPEISSVAPAIDVVMLITNPTVDDPKDTTLKFIRNSRIDAQIREFFFVYGRLTEDNYEGLTPLMVNRALIFSTIDDATSSYTSEEPIHAAIRAELQAAYPNIWESLPKGKTADASYPSESKSYKIPCRLPAEWRITKIVPLLSNDRIFYSDEITKDGDFIRH